MLSGGWGGYPALVLAGRGEQGEGAPSPRTWLGYPLPLWRTNWKHYLPVVLMKSSFFKFQTKVDYLDLLSQTIAAYNSRFLFNFCSKSEAKLLFFLVKNCPCRLLPAFLFEDIPRGICSLQQVFEDEASYYYSRVYIVYNLFLHHCLLVSTQWFN